MNLLIIYSFLLSTRFSLNQIVRQQLVWLVASCTYQFILNFLSSIIFFISINGYTINFGTTNLMSMGAFGKLHTAILWQYGLFGAFLIKLGVGP